MPEWYLNEPILERSEDYYLSSFYDLDTCRNIGMDVGPISWIHIFQYSQYQGLEPDVAVAFIEIIRSMDKAYLDWVHRKKPNGQ